MVDRKEQGSSINFDTPVGRMASRATILKFSLPPLHHCKVGAVQLE
jgi:hypothetical protein